MKNKTGTKFAVATVALAMVAALLLMVGCGGGSENNATSDEAQVVEDSSGSEDTSAHSIIIDDVEFTPAEVDFNPPSAPVNMPEGNKPFEAWLDFSGSGDAREALSTLKANATLLVNGEEVVIGATAYSEEGRFVTLISSTSADLEAADLSIILVYGDVKLVLF